MKKTAMDKLQKNSHLVLAYGRLTHVELGLFELVFHHLSLSLNGLHLLHQLAELLHHPTALRGMGTTPWREGLLYVPLWTAWIGELNIFGLRSK